MPVRLTDIATGSRLRVIGYTDDSDYAAQLRRLGLVPGTEVTVARRAPLGDPIEIRLRGFSLALRPSEAQSVLFEVIST